ncbi:hypothetical protein HDV57DRAFT_527293 [Trichoderma longibrachiatum]
MGPFEWLAAQNEGVMIAVILVAVIALVLVLPFVVTGTCYYVDRGVRLALKSCRSLLRNYRAVVDQDVVAMEKGEYRLRQAAPVVAPILVQTPSMPAYFLTGEAVASPQIFMPLEPPGIQQVFVPAEIPIIQPLPQVFIPAETRELLGAPPQENMSLIFKDEDIDLSMEVEVASFSHAGLSTAPSEEELASPLSDKSEPFMMVGEPSPFMHETVATSTGKTSVSNGDSPPHSNTTRATTPETEFEENHRISDKAKARSWEAPNARPRTPGSTLRLDRVSEQSGSEAD